MIALEQLNNIAKGTNYYEDSRENPTFLGIVGGVIDSVTYISSTEDSTTLAPVQTTNILEQKVFKEVLLRYKFNLGDFPSNLTVKQLDNLIGDLLKHTKLNYISACIKHPTKELAFWALPDPLVTELRIFLLVVNEEIT